MNQIKKLARLIFLSWNPSFNVRIGVIMAVLMGYVCYIISKTAQTVGPDRAHYEQRIRDLRRDSVPITQLRGVIFSESGEMIAASLPQYDVYLDFRNKDDAYYKTVYDSLKKEKVKIRVKLLPEDTINYYFSANGPGARYLHQLAPSKSAAEHARGVREAYKRKSKRYRVLRAVSYLDFKKLCAEAPFFSKNKNHIGLFSEERPHRQRPYGETRMASSTIGGVFPADTFRIDKVSGQRINYKGHGRNGLEQTFDSLLAGTPGLGFTERVRNTRVTIVEREPVDGADVYTTIDMEMQNILDYELNKRIVELNAEGGWAAVMETKTGKIKAISNLKRVGNRCVEDYNHFVQDVYDPGSTFKTVSYMVLLDDNQITPDTEVDTGNTSDHPSHWNYFGKDIRDDHPVGCVSADEAMAQSSNIALAKLTTKAYSKDPQRYLDLIKKTRAFEDLDLRTEFQGAQRPRIKNVGEERWSPMSLAQISYGYETSIPGMYILNFYNAIANDGKLMRPYIVSRVVKDGDVLYEREPEVINSSICKSSTLKSVRHALESVVEHGTAATKWNNEDVIIRQGAKSKRVKIAGKTGTAQRYAHGSYSGNGHYVSFAGYFPANDPQYTCLVVIDSRPNGNSGRPGGGYMAGPVFRNFAEQIYARSCYRTVDELQPDSASIATVGMLPKAKRSPESSLENVIKKLHLGKQHDDLDLRTVSLSNITPGRVPDVRGMGAAEALYMLENAGLRVNVSGRGKVDSQSLAAGSACTHGQTISITLN